MVYFISNQKRLDLSDKIKQIEITECIKELTKLDSIALDTETRGFDSHTCALLSMQLGDRHNQYVIDCTTVDISVFREILESKLILMHNAQFDLRFLYKHNIFVKNVYDTFLAECILTTGLENKATALDGVARKYTGEILDKTVRGVIHRELLSERVIFYGAKDVAVLHTIMDKQLILIDKYNLRNVLDLENNVVKVFARMCYDGIGFDPDRWMEVAEETESYTKELEKELDDIVLNEPKLKSFIPSGFQMNLFGFKERKIDIKWSSPIQKLKLLQKLGIQIEGVGEPELIKVQNKHCIIPKLIEYSKTSKLANAFGRDFLKFVNKKTKRIHMQIWQILNTGRISVSEPNLNQIPSKHTLAPILRSAFVPSEGYKIVGGDYQGFELAIIAEFSGDDVWVNTLKEGGNLHSVLASKTFNVPLDKVNDKFPLKPDLTYRGIQKTINFGWIDRLAQVKFLNIGSDSMLYRRI